MLAFLNDTLLYMLLILMAAIPFFINGFFKSATFFKALFFINLISLPLIFAGFLMISYWPEFYADARLEMLGYDFEGMNLDERIRNIEPAFRAEAIQLAGANMGIGWPLQAMFMSVFTAPYPTAAYLLIKLYRKIKCI